MKRSENERDRAESALQRLRSLCETINDMIKKPLPIVHNTSNYVMQVASELSVILSRMESVHIKSYAAIQHEMLVTDLDARRRQSNKKLDPAFESQLLEDINHFWQSMTDLERELYRT